MRSFVLTCVVDRLVLSDFDTVLQKGDVIELTESQIASSQNLQMALRHGGVTIKKKKPNPKVRVSSRIQPKKKRVKKLKTPTMEERLKVLIADTVEQKLAKILEAIENQPEINLPEMPAQSIEFDTNLVVSAVQQALSGISTVAVASGSSPSTKNVPLDDTPMFIPTGMVESDLSGDIDTEQESSKGSSVDAATEALRMLRKAKKK